MSDVAIHVENLSKSYQITRSVNRGSYKTLQEEILRLLRNPLNSRKNAEKRETFWALRDVSFNVEHGEVLGIIGRNGAGKSTLLKILSRITRPTKGYADLFGRIGSLLEVGTGFHPELTGRENIYLNGAILGMTKYDIQRCFDEIVDFAEIQQFLDTPVKRYSSGMYMRLAFAVAAHLEPEILVIDEVLAVGDAKFQAKCIGKMSEVARDGRTVLFVSHNMAAVQQLCSRGIVLEDGIVAYNGNTADAIEYYVKTNAHKRDKSLAERLDRKGQGNLKFTSVEICNARGESIESILSGQDVLIRFHYTSEQALEQAAIVIAFNIYNTFGSLLTNFNTRDLGIVEADIRVQGYFECRWPRFNLRAGLYDCALYCEVNGQVEDWLQAAFQLQVEDGDFHGTGLLPSRDQGDILVTYTWNLQPTAEM